MSWRDFVSQKFVQHSTVIGNVIKRSVFVEIAVIIQDLTVAHSFISIFLYHRVNHRMKLSQRLIFSQNEKKSNFFKNVITICEHLPAHLQSFLFKCCSFGMKFKLDRRLYWGTGVLMTEDPQHVRKFQISDCAFQLALIQNWQYQY